MARESLADQFRQLKEQAGEELTITIIRVVIVTTALFYFQSDFFAARAPGSTFAEHARLAVTAAFCVTLLIAASLILQPQPSQIRRIAGLVHDILAVSTAMYLGEGAAAPVASIYLWVTLGQGFRFGVRYLYGSAILALAAFAAVYQLSPYWQRQGTLSFNIFMLLVLIPPYVGALLTSLHGAKERLRKQAHTDSLTGLRNRQAFEQEVERIMDHDTHGHALLFCDLDHFKDINDTAGHAAGDKLLQDIAEILATEVRGSDLTGRLGGDEFCAFLPCCPVQKAREVAERIRNQVSGYRLAWGNSCYSVGVSIGIAPSDCVKDAPSLFRLADAAAYAAKNAGRNQVYAIDPLLDDINTASVRRLIRDSTSAIHRTGAAPQTGS